MASNKELFPKAEGSGGKRTTRKKKARRRGGAPVLQGKLKVHDPFELVRWLALSQPDPRKALAELVQNSLDAGAKRIRVTRVRRKGLPCLEVLDDGEGVIPELDRPEALRYIATNVGHSRKRNLSPEERLKLMTQGQYGIGLLGFWTLGQMLEMRSTVPGQKPHRLVLYRDQPKFIVEGIRKKSLFEDRYTEVVVVDLHRQASAALTGRRAADFLAVELRGQLLERDVELVVEDRMARGRAEKVIPVRPRPFLGEPISDLSLVPVPDHPPIRLDLYLADQGSGAEAGQISVYAAGTLVAGGFEELGALGLDRPPWTDPGLAGLVDFPGLHVSPGSRRGIIPDAAAAAFVAALCTVEPRLHEILEEDEQRRAEELDRKLIRDLQRAFKGFYRQQPRYTLLPVRAEGEEPALDGGGEPGVGAAADGGAGAGTAETLSSSSGSTAEPALPFPAGPLASLVITPDPVRLRLGASRVVTTRPVDASQRRVDAPVSFRWWMTDGVAAFEDEPTAARVRIRAGEKPGSATLHVRAWTAEDEVLAETTVEVSDAPAAGPSDEGIPEPELIDRPGEVWRSRLVDGRWQVNSGHPEMRSIRDRPALEVRYLAMLFAKEVVLRSSQDPRLEGPLEQLVEIAAFADRNLARRRKGR